MNQEKHEAEASAATNRIISEALDRVRAGHQEEQVQQDDQDATKQVAMTATAAIVIDEAKKQELVDLFNVSINDPRFWNNDKRVDRLREALKVPVSDDRSYQQCYIHAETSLIAKAAKLSKDSHQPVVMPTEEQIHAEAQINYDKKVAAKAKKAQKKAE